MLVVLDKDCRPIMRRSGLFERMVVTSRSAVCERKLGDFWSVWSYASMTLTSREVWEEKVEVYCSAQKTMERGVK